MCGQACEHPGQALGKLKFGAPSRQKWPLTSDASSVASGPSVDLSLWRSQSGWVPGRQTLS